ncbi:HNH endonuclease [Streptomyces puniciscabiei]|uniref:HNH endonuclease n=1 Tax=Streptomyces puniciscabiei TaxID=164348 RepID=UPI00331FF473
MPDGRPSIPAPLRRAVLEEAGYSCAIPTCRAITTEIAHIDPYVKVKEHTFDNLIALCPNCHTRYDIRKDIPKASIVAYKRNLAVLNGRYSDLERRLLEEGADYLPGQWIPVHIGVRILIRNLLADGLLAEVDDFRYKITGNDLGGIKTTEFYQFTEKGRDFIERWRDAELLID